MNDFEKGLSSRINERIKLRGYCVVYDSDLRHFAEPSQKEVAVKQQTAAYFSVSPRDRHRQGKSA